MTTESKHTAGEWFHDGTTVYALEHHGWSKGEEVMRNRFWAGVQGGPETPKVEVEANARLFHAAPELLAYAECEEAKRVSLLPTDRGGTGDSQSYMDVFNRHGWDGRDVYSFLDRLRRAAIGKALGHAA